MFTTIGVKIDLNTFLTVCKKLFNSFESELTNYTTNYLNNKDEDNLVSNFLNENDAIIDFLSEKANHYFSTINVNKQITIFEWNNDSCIEDINVNKNKNVNTNITIIFGISLLTCDNEAMKSIPFNEVNACMEDMKVLIKHFDIDESKIELISDSY